MIELDFGDYKIYCSDEYDFKPGSADNVFQYNHVYDQEEGAYKSSVGIKIYQNEELIDSAFISFWGGGTVVTETSVIIDDGALLACCGHSVFCFKIPTFDLLWHTIADMATSFEIFPIRDGYIVHGELQITRLNKNGIMLWQTYGADIFVTVDGSEQFEVTESYIIATDWNNDVYVINFDGETISHTVKR